MIDTNIILPSKPRIVSETETKGVYEIDGLYPGYGHTLGNSLRRIILSSLPGAAITSIKIDGVSHEFSTIEGVKQDVITMILALKKVRFKLIGDEPQVAVLEKKGLGVVTAGDIKVSGQLEILNGDLEICEITDKSKTLKIEMTVEHGIGFVDKDTHQKDKVDIGTIALDAIFTPIRRVSYDVENMRVGDKTNHNRLRLTIETDGTISPKEALESSIHIMITQLESIVGFASPKKAVVETDEEENAPVKKESKIDSPEMADMMKTRIDTLDLSPRIIHALSNANIRTLGGIARKKEEDLLDIEGLGDKGIQELKRVLAQFGISLK